MNKKSLLVLFVVLLLIAGTFITSCAPKAAPAPAPKPAPAPAPAPAPTPAPAPKPTPTSAPTPAPTPAQPAKVIKWKGTLQAPPGSVFHDVMTKITTRINTAAGGAMELTLNPTGSIVPSTQELDGIDKGLVDYAYTGPAYWAKNWPAANLFSIMINGLSGMEYYFWMLEGGGLDIIKKMTSSVKVEFAGFLPTPPEVFLESKKALNTVADIKGLKIRTAGDDGELFTRMGAAVITLAGGEVYESLQRGVIDACQLSYPSYDYSLGIHEVVKYMYLSPARQSSDVGPIMVNKDAWAKLTPALQEIVKSVVESEATRYYARLTTQDQIAVQKFKDYGVNVLPASKEIINELVKQSETFYAEKTAKDPLYKEVYDSMRAFQTKIRNTYERL